MNEWPAVRFLGVQTIGFLLAALVAPAAFADWTLIGRAETHVIYVDKATLRQVGKQPRMQVLRDYFEAQLAAPRQVLCCPVG